MDIVVFFVVIGGIIVLTNLALNDPREGEKQEINKLNFANLCLEKYPNIQKIQDIIAMGIDINTIKIDGKPLLALVCQNKPLCLELVKILISAGADVNIKVGDFGSLLGCLCCRDDANIELIKIMLDAGAMVTDHEFKFMEITGIGGLKIRQLIQNQRNKQLIKKVKKNNKLKYEIEEMKIELEKESENILKLEEDDDILIFEKYNIYVDKKIDGILKNNTGIWSFTSTRFYIEYGDYKFSGDSLNDIIDELINVYRRAKLEQDLKDLDNDPSPYDISYRLTVKKCVTQHIDTLKVKHKQTLYYDDYGTEIVDAWKRELEYFTKKVIFPEQEIGKLRMKEIVDYAHQCFCDLALKKPDMEQNISIKTGVDYEHYIERLLKNANFEVSRTPTTGDQGVDLVAIKNNQRIAIQCKYYSKPVGNKAVQEVAAGKDFYDCQLACVVSNKSFTPAARKLANTLNISLLNEDNIVDSLDSLCK